jgi:pimeloyl-ACP methyl ester carboxylesterase
MEKFTTCNGIPVRIAAQGDSLSNGSAVLLLHGYLESLEVWENFARLLGKNFYTLTLDLPGHGLSGSHPEVNSMELMADVVQSVCMQLGVSKVVAVGHSMGGYAALALAKKFPDLVQGLCLLHSTPNPDSAEKKTMRDREIALIEEGKKELLAAQSIPMMFAADNVAKFYEPIADLEANAEIADNRGIIACLRGMKMRGDMNDFLKTFSKPLLFVFGKKDRYISLETAVALMEKFPQAQTLMLENSGHAGFIEEEKLVLEKLTEFATKILASCSG